MNSAPQIMHHPPPPIDMRQCWETPCKLFYALNAEYNFTFDAAASRDNAKLPRYWDRSCNGLLQDWSHERIWCNPPYNDIASWVNRAVDSQGFSALLLPVRADTSWWATCVSRGEIHFFTGRVQFIPPINSGIKASSNREASALILFNNDPELSTPFAFRSAKTGQRILI